MDRKSKSDVVAVVRKVYGDDSAALERERKTQEIINHGKQAYETGLSQFLAAVASIAMAVNATGGKFYLDKNRVARVVKAAGVLQSLAK